MSNQLIAIAKEFIDFGRPLSSADYDRFCSRFSQALFTAQREETVKRIETNQSRPEPTAPVDPVKWMAEIAGVPTRDLVETVLGLWGATKSDLQQNVRVQNVMLARRMIIAELYRRGFGATAAAKHCWMTSHTSALHAVNLAKRDGWITETVVHSKRFKGRSKPKNAA